MDVKFDLAPIMKQLFIINAKIDALTDIVATTKEQQDKLDELFEKHYKRTVIEFDKDFPGVINENPYK